jgi:hypothetical protein
MTLADDDAIPVHPLVHPLVPILVLVPVRDLILLNDPFDATFVIRRDIGKRIVHYTRKHNDRRKERRRVEMTKAKTNLKLRSLPNIVMLMLTITILLFNCQGSLC